MSFLPKVLHTTSESSLCVGCIAKSSSEEDPSLIAEATLGGVGAAPELIRAGAPPGVKAGADAGAGGAVAVVDPSRDGTPRGRPDIGLDLRTRFACSIKDTLPSVVCLY